MKDIIFYSFRLNTLHALQPLDTGAFKPEVVQRKILKTWSREFYMQSIDKTISIIFQKLCSTLLP